METFTVRLAGHNIRIESRYPESRVFFRDYTVPDTDWEIIAQITDTELDRTVAAVPGITRTTAELTGLYRPIAEVMPTLGGFVIHGAAISFGGKGYLFTAPSGTGKSTHIKLWRRLIDGVDIINGDKPIITIEGEDVMIHGTPWSGKERWQKNVSLPLGGICLLRRGDTSSIRIADAGEFLPFLLRQTYYSSRRDAASQTMVLLDKVLTRIPVYSLACDISEDAARCSFETLTGEKYNEHKKI